MNTTFDFEALVKDVMLYASPRQCTAAVRLYQEADPVRFRALERLHDSLDAVHTTRVGLPVYADQWDNRRR
ncbi:hypothetical protein [Azospirillum sp. sgz301742]